MVRINVGRSGALHTLLLIGLLAIGLVASTASPALAQSGTWVVGAAYKATTYTIPRRPNGPPSARRRAQPGRKVARVPVRCSLRGRSWWQAAPLS
jgi:hypothetical protein